MRNVTELEARGAGVAKMKGNTRTYLKCANNCGVPQGLIGLTQTIAAVMVNRVTRPLGEKRALLMAFAGQACADFRPHVADVG